MNTGCLLLSEYLCRHVAAGGYAGAVGLPVVRKENAKGNFQRRQHPESRQKPGEQQGRGHASMKVTLIRGSRMTTITGHCICR